MSETKSKRERQLEENYEEAAFELMMYRMMKSKGEGLLEENRRLEADPEFHVPEELDEKVIKLIDRKLSQKNRTEFFKSFGKVVSRVAVVFLVLAIMFAIPFSTAKAFRTATITFLVELFDDGIQVHPDTNNEKTSEMYHDFMWLPDSDWELVNLSHAGEFFNISYIDSKGTSILYEENTGGIGLICDIEEADYCDTLSVSGFPAMGIEKEDCITLIWKDEVRNKDCNLMITGSIETFDLNTAIQIAENIK